MIKIIVSVCWKKMNQQCRCSWLCFLVQIDYSIAAADKLEDKQSNFLLIVLITHFEVATIHISGQPVVSDDKQVVRIELRWFGWRGSHVWQ